MPENIYGAHLPKDPIDTVKAAKSVQVDIRLTRCKEAYLRFWLAARLIGLAARIMPASVTVATVQAEDEE